MPQRKEPNFYADDIAEEASKRRPKNRQEYSELFASAAAGQLLGEASTSYLFSERAVPNILRDSPHARFIVMLRNPVDMAHALHSHLLRILYEDERSFQKAWEVQDARAAGGQIPRFCPDRQMLLYRKFCFFAWQMERLFQRVPRERVLVHIFEEFFADPKAGYERTLAFLGLPDEGRTDFERVNENWAPRSLLLHRLLRSPPFPHARFYGPLKRTFNAFGLRPGALIIRLQRYIRSRNVRKETRIPIDPAFRRRLAAEFKPDIARLEAVLGRQLDVWRSGCQG